METVFILVGVIVYVGAGLALTYWVYRWSTRHNLALVVRLSISIFVLFALWAIPNLDHELGKREFTNLCEKEAGIRIRKSIPSVDGFRSPFASRDTPLQLGYRFVEEVKYDGTISRHTLGEDRKVKSEERVISTSRYAVTRETAEISNQIGRTEYVIFDTRSSEKIAMYVQFGHQGGWVARQLSAMHVYRKTCPAPPVPLSKFITEVLKPVNPER